MLNYELVNLGTDTKPQNINLGLGLAQKLSYICLLRQYKSVFAWNYDELKMYDTSIIEHTIPMIDDEKPVQQKLRKIHRNLENQIKSELNKLLKASTSNEGAGVGCVLISPEGDKSMLT